MRDAREADLFTALSEVHRLLVIANRPRNRLGMIPRHLSREIRDALEAVNLACGVAAHALADYYRATQAAAPGGARAGEPGEGG